MIKVAFMYDFDKTLSPKDMQESANACASKKRKLLGVWESGLIQRTANAPTLNWVRWFKSNRARQMYPPASVKASSLRVPCITNALDVR